MPSFVRIEYPEPVNRLWLVFFTGKVETRAWWLRLLRPGFRHVSVGAWFQGAQRWVFINPTLRGTSVEVLDERSVDGRFGQLIRDSSLVLRVASRTGEGAVSGGPWCVGTVKRILGLRCRALSPYGLAKHLLANGAEKVEIDAMADAEASPGGPCDCRDAQGGAGAR